VLAALAFVLVLGLLAQQVLDSQWARQAAVGWLESAAEKQGIELGVASLDWGWMPPRARLEGVFLEVSGIHAEIDSLELDLARLRVARRILELGTVAADGVRVRLEGLPERRRPRPEPSQLRVTVRHLDLHDLSFQGSQLPGKITLILDGVNAAWATEREIPQGFLTVDRAHVSAKGIEPVELAVRARIEARNGLEIPSWRIAGDGIQLAGHGSITPSEGARVSAAGTVDLTRLDRVVRAHGQLSGEVNVAAELDTGQRELVRLEITSRHVEAAGFPLDALRGTMVVERDRLIGSLERADFHGGRLRGSYRLAHLKGPTRPHSLQLHGDGVSLAGLLTDLDVPTASLAATFTADASLEWNGRQIQQASGTGVAMFEPGPEGVPVRGRVDCEITPEGLLRFDAEDLSLGRSTVDWQGPLTMGSWQPAWSITASPAVLEEVIPLVNSWTGSQVLPTSITGVADLQVTLSGPWQHLVVGARVDAQPLRMPPMELDRLVAEATIRGSELRVESTRFSVGDGHGEVEGKLAWNAAAGEDELGLNLRGNRLPLERISTWLGAGGQADGAASFTGGLRGSLSEPRGSWAVGIDDATLLGQPLGDGSATVDLAHGRFDGRGVQFDRGLEGNIWWDVWNEAVGGDLEWRAMPIEALGDTAARVAGGAADVRVQFNMTPDEPVSGRIEVVCPDATVVAEAEHGGVTVTASVADAITAHAALDRTADGGLEGNGELTLSSAERLVEQLLPASGLPLTGHARAALAVDWPSGGTPTVNGRLEEVELKLNERPVRLLAPAQFTVSERGLGVDGLHVGVLNDELFARWSIAPDGTLSGNASGTMDALLLRFLLPDWEPAGRATGVVELLGTVDRPLFEGIAELDQGSFRLPRTRTILSGINGTLLLSSDEIILEGVDFRFMQGNGRGGGRIALRNGTVDLGLAGTMSSLRFEILPGLIAFVSGSWRLEGPVDTLDVSGDLTVDRASLRRKDDVASILVDWFGGTSPPPPSQGPNLNLHVEADETIEVRNPFVRLVGSASLDISGTAAQLGIVGKVEFEEGGEVTLQTIRYELERGSLTFSDPLTIEPFIELRAATWVQNYQITVQITGTPDRLMPSVASNPPLSEGEIYSLLALGYRDESLGGGAMGLGLASSVLTSAITAEIDRRARNLLPVDQIRVDPFAESSTGNPTARVSVVKQLNPTWTFIVQSNLSAEREEVIVSRWYLAPGLFLEASRDLDGSYGVDLKLRRPY
jgi:autotransporter translocation and assembly factor TamB